MPDGKTSAEIATLLQSLQKKCWGKDRILADEFALTVPEFNLLTFFYEEKSQPIKFLTRAMNVTPGRITHIVTALENRGYVRRSLNKSDRRVVLVTLSKKGLEVVGRIEKRVIEFFTGMLSSISVDEQQQLLADLRLLYRIMAEVLGEDPEA
jgi:DNA-binding MarR family transcriptional regulator